MQQPQPSAVHQSYRQIGNVIHVALFAHRRASLTGAGAFLFILVVLIAANRHASSNQLHTSLETDNISAAAAGTDGASAASNLDTSATGTDPPPGSKTINSTHVEINGQTIPVPAIGSSTTTVNVTRHSTQSSSGTSTSSSQVLNVSVNSSSHSVSRSASSN